MLVIENIHVVVVKEPKILVIVLLMAAIIRNESTFE